MSSKPRKKTKQNKIKKSPNRKKSGKKSNSAKKNVSKTKTLSKNINNKINKKTSIIISVCVAALLLVVIITAAAAKNNISQNPLYSSDSDRVFGIDVSSHNGSIDWNDVKKEAEFAFIRVGYRGYNEGTVNLDKKAKENLKNANKADIPVGVYFYSQAVNEKEAREEAKFVLKNIKHYDISLPVVIDFEYPFSNGNMVGRLYEADLDNRQRTDIINTFCKEVEKEGYTPAIYASTYIYESHLNLNDIDKDTVIWVADYNKNITYNGEFDIWQFSEKGKCKGVSSKYVDTNYWYLK